jgi:hypothetical protein
MRLSGEPGRWRRLERAFAIRQREGCLPEMQMAGLGRTGAVDDQAARGQKEAIGEFPKSCRSIRIIIVRVSRQPMCGGTFCGFRQS